MTIKTEIILANGFEFTADLAGPDGGDVVLLLHGFPQTRHTWRAEILALDLAGYRACAFDQRGYSAGARPDGVESYRVENLIDDVLAVAGAIGAERFHLVGHDWGGQIAWIAASRHAERIETLSVISRPHPAAFARAMSGDAKQSKRSGHHQAFQRAEATDDLLADGAARLRAALANQGVPKNDVDTYLSTLGEHAALDAAINWYRAAGKSGIAAADVPAVLVPTLFVWGDDDATVGRAAAEGTAAFVDAPYRFVEVAGAGHFVTDQTPDAFPPLLLEHLAAHTL